MHLLAVLLLTVIATQAKVNRLINECHSLVPYLIDYWFALRADYLLSARPHPVCTFLSSTSCAVGVASSTRSSQKYFSGCIFEHPSFFFFFFFLAVHAGQQSAITLKQSCRGGVCNATSSASAIAHAAPAYLLHAALAGDDDFPLIFLSC